MGLKSKDGQQALPDINGETGRPGYHRTGHTADA